MKHLVAKALLVFLLVGPIGGAAAYADRSVVEQAYYVGDYESVLENLVSLPDAEAGIWEARAYRAMLLTDMQAVNDRNVLSRFRMGAKRTERSMPDSVEAKLLRATSIWTTARQTGKLSGFARGYPQKSREMLEAALALEPGNAEAIGMLGSWHLDVVRRGGEAGAKRLGANTSDGLEMMIRAQALTPSDPVLVYHMATCLTALDIDLYKQTILAWLEQVDAEAEDDALAQSIGRKVQTLHNLLIMDQADQAVEQARLWVGR